MLFVVAATVVFDAATVVVFAATVVKESPVRSDHCATKSILARLRKRLLALCVYILSTNCMHCMAVEFESCSFSLAVG